MKEQSSILDIVTVNDKGQIVIPVDARTIANINPGDKLLVMIHPTKDGIVLLKPDSLEAFARNILSQVNNARDNKKEELNGK